MSINWYPGHMAKTRRLMLEDVKNIDAVCEVLDARIPLSSRNPDFEQVFAGKRRMIALNRADQADPAATARWMECFKNEGYVVIETDSRRGSFLHAFTAAVRECCADLIAHNSAKGLSGKRIRVLIAGVPNVGKSSFINRLINRKSAIAADKPGVTRKKQWFSLPGGFDFMDTPGMLWPKIDDDEVGFKLAFCGTIRDDILDLEELACRLIMALETAAPAALEARYGIKAEPLPPGDGKIAAAYGILERLATARGFLGAGGSCDTERMSRVLLDEFRGGKLGRITLEHPS